MYGSHRSSIDVKTTETDQRATGIEKEDRKGRKEEKEENQKGRKNEKFLQCSSWPGAAQRVSVTAEQCFEKKKNGRNFTYNSLKLQ